MDEYWRMRVTLEYGGKTYSFESDGYMDGNYCYWWEEGNGGCDCNRSLFIKQECDESFPEMDCGEGIGLVSTEPIFKYTHPPVFLGIGVGWKEAVK